MVGRTIESVCRPRMNPALVQTSSTNPTQILRYRDRQYAAELMAAAILPLDLFTWFQANEGVSTKEICEHPVCCLPAPYWNGDGASTGGRYRDRGNC